MYIDQSRRLAWLALYVVTSSAEGTDRQGSQDEVKSFLHCIYWKVLTDRACAKSLGMDELCREENTSASDFAFTVLVFVLFVFRFYPLIKKYCRSCSVVLMDPVH